MGRKFHGIDLLFENNFRAVVLFVLVVVVVVVVHCRFSKLAVNTTKVLRDGKFRGEVAELKKIFDLLDENGICARHSPSSNGMSLCLH